MRATSLACLAVLALSLAIPTLHGIGAHVAGSQSDDPFLHIAQPGGEASAAIGCDVCLGSSGNRRRAHESGAPGTATSAPGTAIHGSEPAHSPRARLRVAAPPRAPPTS